MITVTMVVAMLATLAISVAGVPQQTQQVQQTQQLPRPNFPQLSPVMTHERETLEERYRYVEAVREEKHQAEKTD